MVRDWWKAGRRAVHAVVTRAVALAEWWRLTRAARANARFGAAGGGLLTGGIAYAALFSVFAALTLGFTVFAAVLGNNAGLRARVLATLSAALPGLIDTGDGKGAIKPESLALDAGRNVAGVIAVVVMVMSAISCMAALRTAVRAMFGSRRPSRNVVTGKLRELGGLVAMAGAVLVSAVLSGALTSAVHWVFGLLGLRSDIGWVVSSVGVATSFLVDALTFVLIVVVLAGVRPPRRDLRQGAVIAAVGLGLVRLLGTSVVAGAAGRNALLASVTVFVTLLVWINLVSRIVLLAAAWVADPPLTPPDPSVPAERHDPQSAVTPDP
jgi:membrane protein